MTKAFADWTYWVSKTLLILSVSTFTASLWLKKNLMHLEMKPSSEFQKYKLYHRSLICENFITGPSTQCVLEYLFKMPGYGIPLILTLFECESMPQLFCWNLEYMLRASCLINGYFQAGNESTISSHWNMLCKV